MVALKLLHDKASIKRVVVLLTPPVGVGRRQGRDGRAAVHPDAPSSCPRSRGAEEVSKRIAFNLIPHIDVFMEDGFTKEEWKMTAETKKILDPKIKLTATCVRVRRCSSPIPRWSTSSSY